MSHGALSIVFQNSEELWPGYVIEQHRIQLQRLLRLIGIDLDPSGLRRVMLCALC